MLGTPVIRTFEDTFAFGGPRTNRTDAAWDSLIPSKCQINGPYLVVIVKRK